MKKTIALFAIILLLISGCSKAEETFTSMSVLSVSGTVNIERSDQTLAAREGMRLLDLDTVRTAIISTAWLTLDESKLAQLAELTVMRVNRLTSGFKLTLITGEVTSQIEKPLDADESFTVTAGNLVFGVRGTVFTVRYERDTVTLSVETGIVEVTDLAGNVIAVLTDGETEQFRVEIISPGVDGTYTINPDGSLTTDGTRRKTAGPTDLPDGFNTYHYKEEGSIHEFVYEGYWKDGLPNGQGIMTRTGGTVTPSSVYDGNYIDGLAHGEFTITHVSADGTPVSWTFDVDMGVPADDHIENEQGMILQHNQDARNDLIGIPPWAFTG